MKVCEHSNGRGICLYCSFHSEDVTQQEAGHANAQAQQQSQRLYDFSSNLPTVHLMPPDWVSGKEHAALKVELAKAEARIKEYQTNEPIEFAEKLRTMAQAYNVANRRTMYLADQCGSLEHDLGDAYKLIGTLQRALDRLKGVR